MNNSKDSLDHHFNQAYKYLSYRPRTILEMTDYLKKKGASNENIETIIKSLIDNLFLNDTSFAEWYIENRTKFKPRSKFAIQYELSKKGIPSNISEPILSKLNDIDLALKSIQPRLTTWNKLNDDTLNKKILNYLRYRGFSYGICIEIFENIKKTPEKI